MLLHGHIPKSFSKATDVPIPKNIRFDCTVSSNYRAIALNVYSVKFWIKLKLRNVTLSILVIFSLGLSRTVLQ